MKELRCIVLGHREVFTAVVDYKRKRREPLPNGEVKEFEMAEGPVTSVRFSLESLLGERGEMTCHGAELTAAVIEFLIGRKVPIPKAAKKHLTAIRNELSLTLEVEERGGRDASARPKSLKPRAVAARAGG